MYLLDDNDSSKDIDVASLSTGLKAFVILKQLLINGNVQDKDVIVLDEPERYTFIQSGSCYMLK